jgi:hypothetical protein
MALSPLLLAERRHRGVRKKPSLSLTVLSRPQGSDSASASEDGLDLDLGGASASPDLGLGPTTSQGGHHYPTPS